MERSAAGNECFRDLLDGRVGIVLKNDRNIHTQGERRRARARVRVRVRARARVEMLVHLGGNSDSGIYQ